METLDRMDLDAYPWGTPFVQMHKRLRRCFWSYYAPSAATHYPTMSVFNASTGDSVIAIIGWNAVLAAAAKMYADIITGTLGSNLGAVSPMWAGERTGNGQHYYADTLTTPASFLQFASATSFNFLGSQLNCWAILPPGWSFVLQSGGAGGTMSASFFWQEYRVDDPQLGLIGHQ
jgi:hypothetical protein